jgi:hypothetical protein
MQTTDKSSSDFLNKTAQDILKLGNSSPDGAIQIVKLSEDSILLKSNENRDIIDISSELKKFEYNEAMMQLVNGGYITKTDITQALYHITDKGKQ